MSIVPHTERFTVYSFQEDATGTATVQSLCDYMQEAAGNHAAILGLSIERLHSEGVAWVLARMRIALERLPGTHETVAVTTWPVGVEGLQYRRDFIVRDEAGGLLLRATTQWVVVSLSTRKVVRVPAFIASVALDNAETALEDGRHRLPDVGGEHAAGTFTARLADIDRNLHVNNVRYMDWILESVPASVREGGRLAEIEIVYKAEAYAGDGVTARTLLSPDALPGGEKLFYHSLVRDRDAKELVRAQSVWKRQKP